MKKKCNRPRWNGIHRPWVKILFAMKLSVIFSLLLFSQAFALKSYSQRTLLNLKMENASIKAVLNAIEDKSEYFFLYNDDLINVNRTVSINVKNEKIQNLLSQLFADKSVSFLVKDRQIVLSPAAVSAENNLITHQPKSVSGKVTDSSGASLPGVSVAIKGTTFGTVTTEDGSYNLANVPENGILVFFVRRNEKSGDLGQRQNNDRPDPHGRCIGS